MKDDMIYRQAAIDAFDAQCWERINIPISKEIRNAAKDTIKKLPAVPTCEDAVSRQAAIDAIGTWDKFGVDERGRIVRWHEGLVLYVRLRDVFTSIVNLPAVQPEQSSEIQDILDYLDTVLHPIISPEHWNVYSELHDMISALPSATQQKPLKYSGNGSICCHCKTQDCTGCLYEPMMCKE